MCLLCEIIINLLLYEKDEKILVLIFLLFSRVEKSGTHDEDDDKIITIYRSKL